MAGFSSAYIIGGQGGVAGSDGVNPIRLFILIGDAHRQWLQAHYVDETLRPLGKVRRIVPAGPDHPDSLLDACIAFYPGPFSKCGAFPAVETALRNVDFLDFDAAPERVPREWVWLRQEAREILPELNVWRAVFVPVPGTASGRGWGPP